IMSTEGQMPDQLVLTSPEFKDGGAIPRRFTCDAENVSPPLSWSGAPAGAVTLALVMDDPDARGFVHWVVYNIDASATGSPRAGRTPRSPSRTCEPTASPREPAHRARPRAGRPSGRRRHRAGGPPASRPR